MTCYKFVYLEVIEDEFGGLKSVPRVCKAVKISLSPPVQFQNSLNVVLHTLSKFCFLSQI
jgi:hypothetical protein